MLQEHDCSVCLPYWDSTLDCVLPNPLDGIIWSPEFLGNNKNNYRYIYSGQYDQ